MAKKTLLQHIQKLQEDLGLGRSDITTLTGLDDEHTRLVTFWNKAYVAIQNIWQDWRFLWAEHSETTVIDQAVYAAPADWGMWDQNTITYDGQYLDVYEYESVKGEYVFDTTSGTPYEAVIMPNGSLKLNPPPDSAKTLAADYFMAAETLTNDSDLSRIPEQYEDIVISRAMIYYGHYEEAPSIIQAGADRFGVELNQLEANQLYNQFGAHTRSHNDLSIQVKVE
jgi:hypothetical protein